MVDKIFFEKYHRLLVWLFNTRVGKWFFKIEPKGEIVAVFPNAIRWLNPDGSYSTEFRTNNRYAYRLNTLLRYFPFLLWEREYQWYPQLRLGLTVSTFYPNPDVETTSVDGLTEADYANGSGKSWANLIADAGTASYPSISGNQVGDSAAGFTTDSITTDFFRTLRRSIYLFDTSAIADT